MKAFLLLQKNKLKKLFSLFKKGDWVRLLVFLGFLIVALILAGLTYAFTRGSFLFLRAYPQFMRSLSFYILSSWFFIIFILVFGSSLVSAVSILFKRRDDNLLLPLPIDLQTIFSSRLLDLLVISSWPVIVFGFPLLFAFKNSFMLSWTSFGFSLFALVLLLIIATLIAAIISLKLFSVFAFLNKKIFYFLEFLVLPFLAFLVINTLIPPGLMNAFRNLKFAQIESYISSLPISSKFLPSNWGVKMIFYWQEQKKFALLNFARLLFLIIGLGSLLFWLVKKEYFSDLAKAKRGRFIAGPQDKVPSHFGNKQFPYFLKGRSGAFLEKDFLTLFRNNSEVLQLGLFLFIVSLYFLAFSRIPLASLQKRLPNFSQWKLNKLNLLFSLHILSLFALRFLYPQVSSEGQMSWMVWSAPFKKAGLFWQKSAFGSLLLGTVSLLISGVSTLILGKGGRFFFFQLFVLFVSAVALQSINLALGALLPNFEEKNPEKMSTSLGGIITTLVCLAFVSLLVFLLFDQPAFRFQNFNSAYLVLVFISGLITLVSYLLFKKKINNYQF